MIGEEIMAHARCSVLEGLHRVSIASSLIVVRSPVEEVVEQFCDLGSLVTILHHRSDEEMLIEFSECMTTMNHTAGL
jgi:hypothetical protein